MVVQKRGSKFVEMRAGASGIVMPRIKGSSIRVSILAGYYMDVTAEGLSHEEAVDWLERNYPTLSRPEIEGGLAYWRAHKADIDAEIARDNEMYEEGLAAQTHPVQPLPRS